MSRLPTYFISHGGGPWPWVPEMRQTMPLLEQSLVDIPKQLPEKPKAILVISGHWEAPAFSVMSNAQPPMIYDYYGFPDYTYQIQYQAPGAPAFANRVHQQLKDAGINAVMDASQGFDHGTFAPLYIMYPKADMPIFQLSLKSGYNVEEHLAVGRALQGLRDEGLLIIGSGLSYHNLRLRGPAARGPSSQFDDWLRETLELSGEARSDRLRHWSEAPSARISHPREDHLVPLMVAVGAAEQDAVTRVYFDQNALGGAVASSYRFG
ncbi:DODA-type extradiol aromatic ring-opening family dioxygenase [Gynuella sp.]|uniref:DODA-type extradiol aromatic ring-opening family dioxygenase n=1 Tax=Gynuella sp. TaxID=2969146 RepID=UPI003D10E74A